MSAQDDVLAAFGEWPRRPVEVKADDAPAPEQAIDGDHVEASEKADEAETSAAKPTSESGPDSVPVEQVDGDQAETAGESGAGVGEESSEPVDAAPDQPYLDPAAFFAELQAESAPQPKPGRRPLLIRYASALLLAGAVGAVTAFAVSLPRRTDVPFLGTPSDGRYTFPSAARPAPPAGDPVPDNGGNTGEVHYGDLRQYLLPVPTGVSSKEDGWESIADFESSLSESDVSNELYDAGLRHVAWRGWTVADGQHTVIELLQFPDHEAAYDVESMLDAATLTKAGGVESVVPQVTVRPFGDVSRTVPVRKFDQVAGMPGQVERRVVFASGDVVAIVTTTAPAKVSDVPTEQVAVLQAEMLR